MYTAFCHYTIFAITYIYSLSCHDRVNREWNALLQNGNGSSLGGAECARAMNSVIATVYASSVLLETASRAFFKVQFFPTRPVLSPFYVIVHWCFFSVTGSGCKSCFISVKWTMVEGPPSIHLAKDNVKSSEVAVANPLSRGMGGLRVSREYLLPPLLRSNNLTHLPMFYFSWLQHR